MVQNSEFIKDFVEEATGHVEGVEAGLLKMEGGEGGADIIHGIFRNVHSIKGTAGFFGLKKIVSLSHAMENLFGEIRNGSLLIDNKMIDILLSANDTLKAMISDVENSEETDISKHLANISAFMSDLEEEITVVETPVEVPVSPGGNERVLFPAGAGENLLGKIKQGHGLFQIEVFPPGNHNELIENIKSIGNFIGYWTSSGLTSSPDGREGSFRLLFTSVLERSLVALALDLPEEKVSELGDPAAIVINENDLPQKETAVGLAVPAPIESDNTDIVDEMPGNLQPEFLPAAGEIDDEAPKYQSAGAEDTIRVHISLLNDLLDLASEMVLGRNQLLRTLEARRKEITGLNAVLQNIDNITTELQEKIMQTRMQPIAKVFKKFPRIIRELSRKMKKDIELKMEGTEVELDKSIIEALGDPLTHLVRNAVDHGIEKPDAREKKGKPRTGTIRLSAYHEGGHVNINIADNGIGINVENVKLKALEKGLISPAEAPLMGERELLAMLFHPGFSTAEKITDFSGRGVGMDVVKTNIEKLGGTIEIMTNPGQGTNIRLTLPLTLAIISSLIVEVEGQKFALPQVNLQGMVRIKPGDTSRTIEKIRNSEVLRLRGGLLPIVHLEDVLGIKKSLLKNQVIQVLIIKSGSKRYGLVVDNIHDGEEILVKPVPRYFSNCQCYSGVTIMGDGRIAMILDPEGIASRAGLRFTDEITELTARDNTYPGEGMAERQNLLLFQCSGPETFSIDLSMVARVEKIAASQIEKIGDKEFIQFRGEALRVIRPENYLPVNRENKNTQKYHVIIPKLVRYPIGILIEKIHDTIETKIEFNRDDIKAKGLVGSAILDNRIVLFINIYELFEMVAPDIYQIKEYPRPSEKKRTILVVEDTPFFAKTEKKYLESAGYQVVSAVNGKEAWELLQEKDVDAVVSDIEMPVMDGLELVKRIRGDGKLGGLPVVAVTSRTDDRSIRRGLDAGFDFYEFKLDRERLLEKVKLALEKRGDEV